MCLTTISSDLTLDDPTVGDPSRGGRLRPHSGIRTNNGTLKLESSEICDALNIITTRS